MRTKILVIILAGFAGRLQAQCELKTVSIGNFKTIAGKEISNSIIGYSTLGRLNADKSNVVVWLTWISGRSSDMCTNIVPLMMDTAGLYIVVIDAFGNGISSSPSTQSAFPDITIRDMVNAQYILLTRYLHINHAKTLMGISMGGLQVMEWLVSYPDFAKTAISIVGSPKLSSYDLIFWKAQAAMFEAPGSDKITADHALRMASNLFFLNKSNPQYWQNKIKMHQVDSLMLADQKERASKIHPLDWLCQVKAILSQNIYLRDGKEITDVKQRIKAKTLIIVAKTDLIVNPQSSVELARLIGSSILEIDSDCGHVCVICEQERVKTAVNDFMRR